MNKKRIVKDYDKIPEDIRLRIKMQYPDGFASNLITYTNAEGKQVTALPFEAEDVYYLIRMTTLEAMRIIEEDEDYEEGTLRDDFALTDYGLYNGDMNVGEEEEESDNETDTLDDGSDSQTQDLDEDDDEDDDL